MSRHDEPRGRDVVAFLALFCVIGMVGDVLYRDWPRVAAFLRAFPEVLAAVVLVCMLAIAALILGSALRGKEP